MNDPTQRPDRRVFPASQKQESLHAAMETTTVLPASAPPAHDEIARRAYGIYQSSGCAKGHCRQNWQQAERELRKQPTTGGYPQTQPTGRAGAEPSIRSGSAQSQSDAALASQSGRA